jgi:membrane protein implicated in regulation of membrane protease activity
MRGMERPSFVAILCSFLLALLVLELFTFVPRYAESAGQMRRFTHTPLGGALLLGGTLLLALALNFVFVELWSRRRERPSRRNNDTR